MRETLFGVRARRALVGTITLALAGGMLAALNAPSAAGAAAPVVTAAATGMTTDVLPTVQIDGVVWSQAVAGNTVYAGGRFNNARPAGAAAGTNLTARANLLAYDITTGNLVTSFAPSLNGQVLAVAASPDKTRVYVVGDFTTANGQARRRVAAYSTATGQLITTFNPVGVNSQARSVVATNDTVYVGGGFGSVGNGQPRNNLAAFRASDGALLPWNPNADYTVWALAISTDGAQVIAGGSFQNVGGQSAYGLAKVNATSGAVDAGWRPSVRNAGVDAGISSLRVWGNFVYGTTWHFGPGGNLEGTFKIPVSTGVTEWVTDCHGDNYSAFLNNGIIYTAGHAHYCGNMGGGFPQYPAWKFQHAQAWTDTVGGTMLHEVHGYTDWGGSASPSAVDWRPDMAIGSFTGQYQAGWSVDGTNDYVVYGGEFPRVNNTAQQGLVRFAKRALAPKKEGPRFTTNSLVPTLQVTSPTSVRVSWTAGFDRDNQTLTYRVIRNGVSGTPRHTVAVNSSWWNTPTVGFVDAGLAPGSTNRYQVVVNDADGNTVYGTTATMTQPGSVSAATPYAARVRTDGARIYWPLNETSGNAVSDRAGGATASAGIGVSDATAQNGVTWNQTGAVPGDSALALGSGEFARAYAQGTETATDTFTSQVWIRTSTTSGGRILGFSDLQTGMSGHRDRHVYMSNNGRLHFGVRADDGSLRTVSSARAYNDSQWHMITMTMGPQGMALYVDGVRVGRRSDTTAGEAYLGYWRLGGDNLDGWPSRPAARDFNGHVDEVAIYSTVLTQAQIVAQYGLTGRTSAVPQAPADAYGAAVYADEPDLYWRLGETSGSKAADSGASMNDGTYRNGVTLGATGVVPGNRAATFGGTNQFVSSDAQFSNPTAYSLEAWFKTTSNRGGKVIGFGDNQTGSSGSYDRHVYLQDDGRVVFGVWTGQANTITTAAPFNDGSWHHVVAVQGSGGMRLYLDGVLVGSNPQAGQQAYSGYWKVGGDTTWGSTSAYLAGSIDEAAVYSQVLPAARVAQHYQAAGGVVNQPPTAAFATDVTDLSVTVDGAESDDPDGEIVSYAWNFGDTSQSTGVEADHTYDEPGTYTITLTVTDDDGSTDAQSHQVTVTASNVAPTAGFDAEVDNLTVAVDAADSSDPDGTIEDYGWDFGDGTTGSGETAEHGYAEAGTYDIVLTVTDDDGVTAVASRSVTVLAPSVFARDTFTRTVTNGWGSADVGGPWTGSTAATNFGVQEGVGSLRMVASSGPTAYLNQVSATDVELSSDFTFDKPGTGGGYYTSLVGRRIGNSDYRAKMRVMATSTTLYLVRTVGGTETILSTQNIAGLVVAPGDQLHLRFQVEGTSTATLRAKLWRGAAEPASWSTTATDSTAVLQAPGAVGIYSYMSGSATNGPALLQVDEFVARPVA